MGKLSILATTSLMINVIAFASLIRHIYITNNTSTYNWSYLFGNILSQILLIIYGVANNAPEIYGPTFLLFLGLIYILYNKYMYWYLYDEQLDIKK